MGGRFEATVVVDRPIEDVFAFLADGENDPKFSPRVLEIAKTTDGPPGHRHRLRQHGQGRGHEDQARVQASPTSRHPPGSAGRRVSKNLITASEGGYDLAREGERDASDPSTTSSKGTVRGQADRAVSAPASRQGCG